jgi:hypothetical protein
MLGTTHTTVHCHTPGDKNPQLCRCENLKTEPLKYCNVLCRSVCLNGVVHCNMDVTVFLDEHCSLMCNWANTNYITSNKIYCTVLYNMLHNYMFRPFFFRPSLGCICLALRVMYPDDKVYYFDDEISVIL